MTISEMFSATKYYIDFYQREYKWKKEHIDSLLNDIFIDLNWSINQLLTQP